MEVDTRGTNVLANSCTNYLSASYRETSDWASAYDSPTFSVFFSKPNTEYVLSMIEKVLHEMTGEPVRVPANEEFAQTMIDFADRNPALSQAPDGVHILNRAVIAHEANVQYNSLRQRKLYYKYFINQDRQRVVDYGAPEKVMRGEVTVDPSGYLLSNPWKQYRSCYLNVTHGLYNESGGTGNDAQYCRVPGFLQPKVAPPNQPAYSKNTEAPSPQACFMDALHHTLDAQGARANSVHFNTRNTAVDRGQQAWAPRVSADMQPW